MCEHRRNLSKKEPRRDALGDEIRLHRDLQLSAKLSLPVHRIAFDRLWRLSSNDGVSHYPGKFRVNPTRWPQCDTCCRSAREHACRRLPYGRAS